MEKKKWYQNLYVLFMVLVSVISAAMAGLVLLLLPGSSEIFDIMQWRMMTADSFYVEADVSYSGWVEWRDDLNVLHKEREAVSFSNKGWVDRSEDSPNNEEIQQEFSLSVGAEKPSVDFSGEYRKKGESDGDTGSNESRR